MPEARKNAHVESSILLLSTKNPNADALRRRCRLRPRWGTRRDVSERRWISRTKNRRSWSPADRESRPNSPASLQPGRSNPVVGDLRALVLEPASQVPDLQPVAADVLIIGASAG